MKKRQVAKYVSDTRQSRETVENIEKYKNISEIYSQFYIVSDYDKH